MSTLTSTCQLDMRVVLEAFGHDLEHRAIGRERHVLLEPGDAQARLPPDGAGVWYDVAADDLEQR